MNTEHRSTTEGHLDELTDRLEVALIRARTGALDADSLYTLAAGLLDAAGRMEDPYEVRLVREIGQKVARLAAVAVAKHSGGVSFKAGEVRFKLASERRGQA